VTQNPGFLPYHPQNWITCSFATPNIPWKFQKDPSWQTDRQTLAKT